ncbi:MAG: TonB-dependent receptor, partial [Amphiplicatus sp.]
SGRRIHQIYLNARAPFSMLGDPDNPDDGLLGPGSPDFQNSTAFFLQEISTDSYAIFGEATYDLTQALKFTFGARYTSETKDFSVDVTSLAEIPGEDPFSLFLPGGPFTASNEETWGRFTPKAVVQYDVSPSANVYFSYARGFKSGGFNGQIDNPDGLAPFEPEVADNFEIGFKTAAFDNRVTVNLALFQVNFKDLQVAGTTAEGLIITGNAADARIRGLELDFLARPTTGLTLRGGVSLLDAQFRDWIKEEFDPTVVGGPPFVLVDKRCDRLDDTPEYSVFLGAEYEWAIADAGKLALGVDFVAKGDTVTNENTRHANAYQVLDARLDWRPGDDWVLGVWVKNLTDEVYYRGGGPVPDLNKFITRVGFVSDPRTYGISVRKSF